MHDNATKTGPAAAWIPESTAILVVHGIGNQEPLQTLDQFGRGLLDEFQSRGVQLSLTHGVAAVPGDQFVLTQWLSLQPPGGGPVLDVYEYYWADIAQDQASAGAVQHWLDKAVSGARNFYEDNSALVEKYERGGSIFFKEGKFRYWRYWRFLFVVGRVIPFTTGAMSLILRAARSVPLVGQLLSAHLTKVETKILDVLSNVVGDVVVFNSVHARSPFVQVRNRILDGCVSMLRMLLEPRQSSDPATAESWRYDRVIVTGHSLGSQITFEAINRLNMMIASGQVRGVSPDGCFTDGEKPLLVRGKQKMAEMLGGFVTFGSPLDKVAFFFREQARSDETIRRNMLNHLRCFKHKPWNMVGAPGSEALQFAAPMARLFDDVRWLNLFDRHDPVSGSLDYYEPVENRNCEFKVQSSDGVRTGLFIGAAIWLLALVAAFGYWATKLWNFGWIDVEAFKLSSFVTSYWGHWPALVLFLFGTVLLLFLAGSYLAGNFTHLRYWNRAESPLYKALVDEFLYPKTVRPQDAATLANSDVT